ncbi:MAG TPA: rhomboid family intramembrane serine protease [Candidatus Limnocylindrales bacterium]
MIPLRDANPTRQFPIVTVLLIVACTIAFIYEIGLSSSGGDAALERFISTYGAVPDRITASLGAHDYTSPAMLGILSSMFLHGGWLHLIGNMLYLWIFGNNVEDRFGRLPFIVFYLLGGIAAAFAQVAINPESTDPLIGASGAIAATLGAYLVLYPGARVLSLVFLGFFYQLLEVPAVLILGFWFVLQLIDGLGSLGAQNAQGGVAFFAHVGGFVSGMAVGFVVRVAGGGRPPSRVGQSA